MLISVDNMNVAMPSVYRQFTVQNIDFCLDLVNIMCFWKISSGWNLILLCFIWLYFSCVPICKMEKLTPHLSFGFYWWSFMSESCSGNDTLFMHLCSVMFTLQPWSFHTDCINMHSTAQDGAIKACEGFGLRIWYIKIKFQCWAATCNSSGSVKRIN